MKILSHFINTLMYEYNTLHGCKGKKNNYNKKTNKNKK